MKKSTQNKIDNHLDVINRAKGEKEKAQKRVNSRLKRLTSAKTPIFDIFSQMYKETLKNARKNLNGI